MANLALFQLRTRSWRAALGGRRRRARGAAFVEAVMVISALSLGLVGLIFFRELYLRQIGAMRLARAAAIAHSMAGCEANAPADWIGRDLQNYTSATPRQEKQPVRGKTPPGNVPGGADDNGRSTRLLGKTGGTTSDGEGMLNPIFDAEFTGRTRVSKSDGRTLARSQTTYEGRARSRSFVTCGDEVKDGDYDKILAMVKDEAVALFNTR